MENKLIAPVPIIDKDLCDGCGLCVQACPHDALSLINDKAVVSLPQACEYEGHCEMICPVHAINRPFQILMSQQGG
ncbi:MAG: 4Fe-4S binding protein [Chloroflexota bacterium]